MFEILQVIEMTGYGTEDVYYDRAVDIKHLTECKDEFEVLEYYCKNICNMPADFVVSIHNMDVNEVYSYRYDHTSYDERLNVVDVTTDERVQVGFEVKIVVKKIK